MIVGNSSFHCTCTQPSYLAPRANGRPLHYGQWPSLALHSKDGLPAGVRCPSHGRSSGGFRALGTADFSRAIVSAGAALALDRSSTPTTPEKATTARTAARVRPFAPSPADQPDRPAGHDESATVRGCEGARSGCAKSSMVAPPLAPCRLLRAEIRDARASSGLKCERS